MAEVTAMRNNVLPYPIYGCPYVVVFPFLDADGDLVPGATAPDAEISKNGDTFVDCTNESVEIATTSGMYYLILTATEMQCNIAAVIAKSTSTGLKTTPIVLEPQKLVAVRSGTSQTGAAGSITLDASASAVDDFYNGMVCVATIDTLVEVRMISDYVGSTKVASVEPNWNVTPDADDTFVIRVPHGHQMLCHAGSLAADTITATSIAADAFTAAKFAADVSTEFATTLLGTAVPGAFGAGTLGRVIGRSCPDVTAGAAGGLFIAGTNAATTITTSLTTTFTGNLTGSVASVSGAVGSITPGGYAGGYDNSSVWIDTGAGVAGTTNFVHGIVTNPNSSMANSRTIANSLKLKGFHVANGSSITLDQGYNNFTFFGEEWTLALANRAITNSRFYGAVVTGLSTGVGCTFYDCNMGTCTLDAANLENCEITASSTITMGTAGTFVFDNCHSSVPTGSEPTLDLGAAVGASTVSNHKFSGALIVANLKAGDTYSHNGWGRLTLAASCTGGTALISGNINLVNNGSGITIIDTSRYNEDQNVTNVTGNVTGSVGSVAAGGITAASIATGAIDADALAADAGAEIADAVWDEAIAGHLVGGSTGAALNAATAPTAAAVADAVWDEALAGHLGAGSTGAALNAAGAAGDPWSTALPGAYGAGTAGYKIGTNLDAKISDIVTAVNTMPASILATGGSEPAIAPEHTAGIGDKIDYLYATLKNEWTLNRNTGRYTLKTEGGVGTIAIYDAVSNATTFTKGEIP